MAVLGGRVRRALVLGALSVSLLGCATDRTNVRLASDPPPRIVIVGSGTVLSARQVEYTGDGGATGAKIGAVAGGFALSGVGAGSGNALAMLGGVLAGAVIGAVVGSEADTRISVEYTVKLVSGETIVVIQERGKDDPAIAPGDAVLVRDEGGARRIVPPPALTPPAAPAPAPLSPVPLSPVPLSPTPPAAPATPAR